MTTEQQIDLAKRHLAKRDIDLNITFRGVPLEHFTASELIKIVAIAMKKGDSELNFYKAACEGFRALADVKVVHEYATAHSSEELYDCLMNGWEVVSANVEKEEWELKRPRVAGKTE